MHNSYSMGTMIKVLRNSNYLATCTCKQATICIMHIKFYNSTADVTLIAVIVLAVTFAGMLTICTICEYYIVSNTLCI